MKVLWSSAALSALCASFAFPVSQDLGGLVSVQDPDAPGPSELSDSFAEWRTKLTDPDLERREAAFDQLVRTARLDAELHAELERWARDAGELAWTSRLALRELERRAPGAGFPNALPFPGGPGLGSDLFQNWDRMFHDWDLHDPFGPGTLGIPRIPGGPAGPGSVQSESRGYSIEQTPDGVRVEVRTDVDGETETKSYEADTLEELLEAHPELEDQIETGRGGVDVFGLPGARFRLRPFQTPPQPGSDPLRSWSNPFDDADADAEIPTHILGVVMRAMTDEDSRGPGLLVERTVSGTIAHSVGVERGDLLVDLNGTQLKSGEDVQRALSARDPGEDVHVTLVDESGARRTLTWSPSARDMR